MGFFRSLFAVIAATVVAFLLGMAFDYFRMAMNLQTEGMLMVFPAVAGAAGFIAAIIALSMARGGGSASRAASASAQTAKAKGSKAVHEVPGMPTFDFDKAKQETKGDGKGKVEE